MSNGVPVSELAWEVIMKNQDNPGLTEYVLLQLMLFGCTVYRELTRWAPYQRVYL